MKYAWIENHRDEYAVSRLCRVLLVSRSGYCQWRVRSPSPRALANEALDAQVALIHRDSRRSYGRPRITQQLRQQGFARAAEHLGLSPSALSQTIRQLETRLGVRLLNRTTRSVAPTPAGSRLHERIAPMLLEMDAAVAEAVAATGQTSTARRAASCGCAARSPGGRCVSGMRCRRTTSSSRMAAPKP